MTCDVRHITLSQGAPAARELHPPRFGRRSPRRAAQAAMRRHACRMRHTRRLRGRHRPATSRARAQQLNSLVHNRMASHHPSLQPCALPPPPCHPAPANLAAPIVRLRCAGLQAQGPPARRVAAHQRGCVWCAQRRRQGRGHRRCNCRRRQRADEVLHTPRSCCMCLCFAGYNVVITLGYTGLRWLGFGRRASER